MGGGGLAAARDGGQPQQAGAEHQPGFRFRHRCDAAGGDVVDRELALIAAEGAAIAGGVAHEAEDGHLDELRGGEGAGGQEMAELETAAAHAAERVGLGHRGAVGQEALDAQQAGNGRIGDAVIRADEGSIERLDAERLTGGVGDVE
ncbi:conserved hypothetical protein, partial [Ricinus communis]